MTASTVAAPLARARAALRAGRFAEAESALRQVLTTDPRHADALSMLGILALRSRNPEPAASLFQRALKVNPRHFEAALNYGLALRATGQRDESRAALEHAAGLKPSSAEAQYHLAMAHIEAREFEEAAKRLRKAVRLDPKAAQLHSTLAGVLLQLGHADDALRAFRKASSLQPRNPILRNNLGAALQNAGDHEGAIAQLRKAIELDPTRMDSAFNLANSLTALHRTDEALDLFQRVIETRPDFPGAHNNYGIALKQNNRFDEAAAEFRAALEAAPGDPRVASNLADALLRCNQSEEALSVLRAATTARPHDDIEVQIGGTLERLGRFEEAVAAFESVLKRTPDHAWALIGLSGIGSYSTSTDREERLRALAGDDRRPALQRVRLHFAAAQLRDRRGEYDEAFAHLAAGNALRARAAPFDRRAMQTLYDALIATFDADFVAAREDWGSDSDLPVFITGMPCTGAILAERMLGAHPSAYGAGELGDLLLLTRKIPAHTGGEFPGGVRDLAEADARSLAEGLVHARRALAPKAVRVADKHPLHARFLGLVRVLWPSAAVVICTRDPRDACLSIFSQAFADAHPYAARLEDLGWIWRQHERLIAHWRAFVPAYELPYEELVADPEAKARELVAHTGLPWHKACLDHAAAGGPVSSARPWLARQPINAASVGHWKKYEEFLGPLLGALESG